MADMIDTLPQSFLMRRPTMDDLEAVHRLFEICEIAELGGPEITLDDLRTLWIMSTFNLESDAWLVTSAKGQPVGYADMEQREHARIFTLVRVHPDYVGRGVGEYLLEQAEAWVRRQIPLAAPEVRVTLSSFTGGSYEEAKRLFEGQGFKEIRRSWRMEIDMSDMPPAPEWPENVTVRTFQPGDERAVFETVDEAFQDHFGHMRGDFEEWKHWTVERETFDPSLWFLAFDGEKLAGCSLCSYEGELGWVNTLAVLRPWRHKGLGMALLLHSFGEFYRRGRHTVGLGVDSQNLTGATRLYERAGMHVARIYIAYEKELRAGVELSTQTITV